MLVTNIEMNSVNNFIKVDQIAQKVEQMTQLKLHEISLKLVQRLITNMNENFEKCSTEVVPMEHKMAGMCKNFEKRNHSILG